MYPEEFVEEWEYALASEFGKDGVPAQYAPGHPMEWGSELRKISSEPSSSKSLAFTPDYKFIAVSHDKQIHIHEAESFDQVHTLEGHQAVVTDLEFAPSVSGTEGYTLLSFSHATGRRAVLPQAVIWNLGRDGRSTSVAQAVSVEEVHEAAKIAAKTAVDHLGHRGDFVIDSEKFEDLTRHFEEPLLSRRLETLMNNQHVIYKSIPGFGSNCFSPDGQYLVLLKAKEGKCLKQQAVVYDVAHRDTRFELATHMDSVMWVGFSPDNKTIATVSWDEYAHLYSAEDGRLLHKIGPTGGQNWTGAFSHNSQYFAFTHVGEVRVHRVQDGALVSSNKDSKGWSRSIAWSPDDKRLLCASRVVILTNPLTGETEQKWALKFKSSRLSSWAEAGNTLWLDKEKFAFATGEGAIEIYDLEKNRKWRWAPKKGDYWRPGFWSKEILIDESRKRVVSVCGQKDVRVWKLDD